MNMIVIQHATFCNNGVINYNLLLKTLYTPVIKCHPFSRKVQKELQYNMTLLLFFGTTFLSTDNFSSSLAYTYTHLLLFIITRPQLWKVITAKSAILIERAVTL